MSYVITRFIPIYACYGLTYNVNMTVECDLNLLPFNRESGKDKNSLPGLAISSPPRRVARGREGDHLFIYLSLNGNNPIQLDEYTKITEKMTGSFYTAQGSLTAALRSTADLFNQVLLTRNLGTTGQGQYIVGRLIMGVLRGNKLIVMQSGPTHIFHLTRSEVEHLHDPALSGRGLGFTQKTNLFYSQIILNQGEHLAICSHLPDNWMSALMNERGRTSLDALYRKLHSVPAEDASAVIIQVVHGSGRLNLLHNDQPQDPIPVSDPQLEIPDFPQYHQPMDIRAEIEKDIDPVRPSDQTDFPDRFTDLIQETAIEDSENQDSSSDFPEEVDRHKSSTQSRRSSRFLNLLGGSNSRKKQNEIDSLPGGPFGVTPQFRENEQKQIFDSSSGTKLPEIKRLGFSLRKPVSSWLLTIIQGSRNLGSKIGESFQTLFRRLLPGTSGEKPQGMSGSTMAFIAMFIPIIVVIAASLIYVRFGRSAQFEENYQLAVSEAVGAIGQTDPAIVRRAWESTLFYLDQAESYQTTQDSNTLRLQAQGSLDAMDLIIRLDFRPAVYGGIPRTIKVGKMVASETDLYLLDENSGRIIRAYLTSSGYILDDEFICGPGTYDSMDSSVESSSNEKFDVFTLIDLQVLPRVNPFGGTNLVAMDSNGTLLFCSSNSQPHAWELKEPDIQWKNPVGFSLAGQNETIYILDPEGNAIWFYDLDVKDLFSGNPGLFFSGDYVPGDLNQANDIAVSGSDLYLLFKDGHVSNCTPGQLGDVVPLRCNDPITMADMRIGYQSGVVLSDANFTEMTFTTPPDPSIYLLAPVTAAVYRFSPRQDTLYLQNQFRATVDQDKTLFSSQITAMAISPNRSLFLCSGSQIYFAMDIP